MSFDVDTDICSNYLDGDKNVFNRFMQYTGGIYLSTITVAELYCWAYRRNSQKRLNILEDLLSESHVISVKPQIAMLAGQIRAEQLNRGITKAITDLIIAATALEFDYTVVTHNTADFADVHGLRVEDWLVA